MNELNDLKKIFLDETLDTETYQDNLKTISEWENTLMQSEMFLSWQEHDATKEIVRKAREVKQSNARRLSTDRTLTQEQRSSLFAKQDALDWILTIATGDTKEKILQTHNLIKKALKEVAP